MLPLTKQERLVLLAVAAVFLCGMILDVACRKNPLLREGMSLMESDRIYSKVDLNRCSYEELERLPGIGPKTAQSVIDYRKKHGPFESMEDLCSFEGIHPAVRAKLMKLVTVEERRR